MTNGEHPLVAMRGFAIVPVMMMLVVALTQVHHGLNGKQTPWKGGGFGMFSTVDQPPRRMVSAQCVTSKGRRCVVDLDAPFAGDEHMRRWLRQLRYRPSEETLRNVADHVMDHGVETASSSADIVRTRLAAAGATVAGNVVLDDAVELLRLRSTKGERNTDAWRDVNRVAIRVWRVSFDSRTDAVHLIPLTDAVVVEKRQ